MVHKWLINGSHMAHWPFKKSSRVVHWPLIYFFEQIVLYKSAPASVFCKSNSRSWLTLSGRTIEAPLEKYVHTTDTHTSYSRILASRTVQGMSILQICQAVMCMRDWRIALTNSKSWLMQCGRTAEDHLEKYDQIPRRHSLFPNLWFRKMAQKLIPCPGWLYLAEQWKLTLKNMFMPRADTLYSPFLASRTVQGMSILRICQTTNAKSWLTPSGRTLEAHLKKYVHTKGRNCLFPNLGFKNCTRHVQPSSRSDLNAHARLKDGSNRIPSLG